jgi:general stress protein 26
VVYLITFSASGERHSRPMTNFNDDPYVMIWFPTYRDTRKVSDIGANNRVLVIFPGCNTDEFFEIEGKAELASDAVVEDSWRWWYLYWHPEMSDRFWFSHSGKHPERVIINIHPVEVKVLRKEDVKFIMEGYRTAIPVKKEE